MTGIAVVGAGYWGSKVLAEYLSLKESSGEPSEIVVVDTSPEAAANAAKSFPQLKIVSTNVDTVLGREDIDAVHICTPNETHFPLAKHALESGKHVLLEKPMTTNSQDAFRLVEIASRAHRALLVGHIFRFNDAIRSLREMIQGGKLGKVYSLRLRWTSNLNPLPERDIIYDLGPHPIDIAQYVLDEWPYKVLARSKSYVRRRPGREEEAIAVLEFPDGKDAVVELSWISPGEKIREVYVRGSSATVRVDALTQKIWSYSHPDEATRGERGELLPLTPNNTIAEEIQHFLSIIALRGANVSSGYVGAKNVEVLDALARSIRDEKFVFVAQPSWPDRQADAELGPRFSKISAAKIGPGTRVYDQVNLHECTIGSNCKIDAFVYIEGDVWIGNNVKVRSFTFIPSGVTIEDDVFIGPHVVFTNDKKPRSKGEWKLQRTLVKRGASVGAGAVICPGVTIGEEALIGAGAVVTADVPPRTIVIGNPARARATNRAHRGKSR